MKVSQALLKQSEASVIKLKNRLLNDQFFRTEWVIITSLFILCVANILIVSAASYYLNLHSTAVVREANSRILASGTFVVSPEDTNTAIRRELSHLRSTTLVVTGTIGVIITLILGFFIAKVALRPTRNALASQKQFIANVAHELRTPLSIIKASNEVLRLESPNNSEIIKMTNSNLEELDRVSGIINNLLTLNAFQDRRNQDLKPVNMSELLHETLDQLSHMTIEKNQSVIRDIGTNLLVIGNKSAIKQIFTNLIKNASTYTPKGGSLTIVANALDAKYVELGVTDSGIGIESHKLNDIFQPFYQVEPSRSSKEGSHGLGLAIVSELVKIHKGRIAIRSAVGVGTTIRVWLPAVDADTQKTTQTERAREVHLDFSQRNA